MSAERDPAVRRTIATSAVLTGLARLIPVPFLDDVLIGEARARMVAEVLACHGHDGRALRPRLAPLWQGRGCLSGCLGLPLKLVIWPLRKLLRTVFFVLGLRSAALEVGRTLALGRTVERSLLAGRLPLAPAPAPGAPDALALQAHRVRGAFDVAYDGIDRVVLSRAFEAALRGVRGLPAMARDVGRRVLRRKDADDEQAIAELPPGERTAMTGAVDRLLAVVDDPSVKAVLEELDRRFDAAMAAPPPP